ncbi:MAG: type II methionyl aminopeptidase [Candidatus Nitrosocaldaceae archaeon]|nr:MAG: type II methionyl aminopeptidase [Candidatus Nitrosocaldaceae archaeon]
MEEYIKAGKIASEVREYARKKYHVGRTLLEICEELEGMIRAKGGEPAFPCNVSLNEIAAHYTAEPDDETIVKDGDVLKIDIGVHINGYIADTAVTTCYNPEYESLTNATELALQEAIKIVKAGVNASDIGKVIEDTAKRLGFMPIHNLTGHSLAQYTVHAGKSIPNIRTYTGFSLQANEAYAIEPFFTTKEGTGLVVNGRIKNIFSLINRKKSGNKDADIIKDEIWNRFKTLPFAARWLKDHDIKHINEALNVLIKKKIVKAYPILVEGNGQYVAQAEHTVIPQENGAIIITA